MTHTLHVQLSTSSKVCQCNPSNFLFTFQSVNFGLLNTNPTNYLSKLGLKPVQTTPLKSFRDCSIVKLLANTLQYRSSIINCQKE